MSIIILFYQQTTGTLLNWLERESETQEGWQNQFEFHHYDTNPIRIEPTLNWMHNFIYRVSILYFGVVNEVNGIEKSIWFSLFLKSSLFVCNVVSFSPIQGGSRKTNTCMQHGMKTLLEWMHRLNEHTIHIEWKQMHTWHREFVQLKNTRKS